MTVPAQALHFDAAGLPPAWLAWLVAALALAPLAWARRAPGLLLWYAWAAGVLLPLLALDLTRSSWHLGVPRYTLLATVGVYPVLAAGYAPLVAAAAGGLDRLGGLGRFRGLAARHLAPAAGTLAAAAFIPAAFRGVADKPDWQPLAAAVAQTVRPGEPILYAGEGGSGGVVYLYAAHYLGPAAPGDRPAVILTHPAGPALARQIREAGRCWVIYAGTPDDLRRLLPGARVDLRAAVPDAAVFGEVVWPAGRP